MYKLIFLIISIFFNINSKDNISITNINGYNYILVSKLISIHPIHSSDYKSYRTVDDLVYEWKQHNLAYRVLPNGKYKDMAKDVDLDPKDQNKTYLEMYNIRQN